MKITICATDGLCWPKCSLCFDSEFGTHCVMHMSDSAKSINGDCRPGPDCLPGVYELVPVDKLKALVDAVEKIELDYAPPDGLVLIAGMGDLINALKAVKGETLRKQ